MRTPLRHRWVNYIAGAWALAFAAPHTWWALGSPVGVPGGHAQYDRFMASSWRYLFDVLVVLLSLLAFVVAISLSFATARGRARSVLRPMAWGAAGVLSSRGIAGMIVDGTSDPVWWPTFFAGGLLFTSVAWLSRKDDDVSPDPSRAERLS